MCICFNRVRYQGVIIYEKWLIVVVCHVVIQVLNIEKESLSDKVMIIAFLLITSVLFDDKLFRIKLA